MNIVLLRIFYSEFPKIAYLHLIQPKPDRLLVSSWPLRGKAFDCAYAQNELGYHQVVNKTVANEFIPNTTVPELKSLLTNALATFKVHEGHAGKMVEGLKCG